MVILYAILVNLWPNLASFKSASCVIRFVICEASRKGMKRVFFSTLMCENNFHNGIITSTRNSGTKV